MMLLFVEFLNSICQVLMVKSIGFKMIYMQWNLIESFQLANIRLSSVLYYEAVI